MTQDEVFRILKERGITVKISGCGCCSSPWVTVAIDGQEVFDDADVYVDTIEGSQPPKEEQ